MFFFCSELITNYKILILTQTYTNAPETVQNPNIYQKYYAVIVIDNIIFIFHISMHNILWGFKKPDMQDTHRDPRVQEIRLAFAHILT